MGQRKKSSGLFIAVIAIVGGIVYLSAKNPKAAKEVCNEINNLFKKSKSKKSWEEIKIPDYLPEDVK